MIKNIACLPGPRGFKAWLAKFMPPAAPQLCCEMKTEFVHKKLTSF